MTVCDSIEKALAGIEDGATLLAGGFGIVGIPQRLIEGLRDKGVRGLTVISNNCGVDDWGLGLLLRNRQIRKMVASYVGENKEFERQLLARDIEVELVPQGTLAERIRAGGAGIPAFYTPAGFGTPIEDGHEVRIFDGKPYLLERGLTADFALVKAWRADRLGNLVYRLTARNFNPVMATAARVTVAEVEEVVETGSIDPDQVHTPSVYVQRVLASAGVEKRIERRTVRA
ncbi:CoA transferase subunit A [Anaeromyxobacter terrae]|uniref:CoA transferase subunit A n=1 Tax=Anaeromyxobacter terrae TaxID=2925406 RepID=UPI001F5A9A4C|nr:CoA transferase subunit A [Anaeromyxobacter sp. SG22]